MRLLYDGHAFACGGRGGICRYFQNLIQNLPDKWTPNITVRESLGHDLVPQHPRLRILRIPAWTVKARRLRPAISYVCNHAYEAITQCDLVHPTYYETMMYRAAKPCRAPMVLTVHDMIDEIFAADVDPDGHHARIKRSAVDAADAIICVSESTRRDLQERYKVPDSKITVTYLANSLVEPSTVNDTCREIERKFSPYVLFVGSRALYKNFSRVLLALKEVRRSWKDLSLCLCGSAFNANERFLIKALDMTAAVHHLGFLPDGPLAEVYSKAVALLYPSLYEGFGIPPLEAMTCGTVVIASNRSSIPEVVGDCGILVDVEVVSEITAAVLQLRNCGAARDALIRRAKSRAALFSWRKTTEATMAVYCSLVG